MESIQQEIKKLRLTAKRLIHTPSEGSFRTFFHGRGIEFATLREYVPGDDIRQIEWNTTARRGTPYIKTFIEERDLTVMLAIDLSSSMEIKRSVLHRLVALLTTLADYHEDRIGCLGFTDRIDFFYPPAKGHLQPEKILHQLLVTRLPNRKTSIKQALIFLRRVMKKHSILFLISDFLDRNFEQHLLSLSRKHELVGVHLYAPIESSLPHPAVFDCYDPESGRRILIDGYDSKIRTEYLGFFRQQSQLISKSFGQSHADLLSLAAAAQAEIQLLQFLRHRQNARGPLQVKA